MTTKKPESEEPKSAPPVQKAAAAPKVFDVAHPGKTAAHAAGRPVIVGHTSMITQDPMVNVAPPPAEAPSGIKRTSIIINPPEEAESTPADATPETKPAVEVKPPDVKPAVATPEEPAEKLAEPKDVEPPQTIQPESPEAPKPDSEPEEAVTESETTEETDDSSAPKSPTDPKDGDEKKVDPVEAKKAERIQQLIDSKQYVVPINSIKQRQTKWIIAFVLFLLVAVAFADLAVDADYLKIGSLKAPTHFFNTVPADTTAQPQPNSAPNVDTQHDTYTSTVDGSTFQYPKSWKLTKGAGSLEFASVEPLDATLTNNGAQGIFLLNFSRDLTNSTSSTSPQKSSKVLDVAYQKIADTPSGVTLYSQTTIVETKLTTSTRYLIYLNLSNTNSLKVGDTVSGGSEITEKPVALDPNGTDMLTFGGELVPYGSDGKGSGPLTLADAQKFLKENQIAKDAQSVLASFKVPAKK